MNVHILLLQKHINGKWSKSKFAIPVGIVPYRAYNVGTEPACNLIPYQHSVHLAVSFHPMYNMMVPLWDPVTCYKT